MIIGSLRILVNFGRGLPFCPFPSVMREEPYLAGFMLSGLLWGGHRSKPLQSHPFWEALANLTGLFSYITISFFLMLTVCTNVPLYVPPHPQKRGRNLPDPLNRIIDSKPALDSNICACFQQLPDCWCVSKQGTFRNLVCSLWHLCSRETRERSGTGCAPCDICVPGKLGNVQEPGVLLVASVFQGNSGTFRNRVCSLWHLCSRETCFRFLTEFYGNSEQGEEGRRFAGASIRPFFLLFVCPNGTV